jgi:hypothetical protein
MSQRRIDGIHPLPKGRSEIIEAAESLSLRYVEELEHWALGSGCELCWRFMAFMRQRVRSE